MDNLFLTFDNNKDIKHMFKLFNSIPQKIKLTKEIEARSDLKNNKTANNFQEKSTESQHNQDFIQNGTAIYF